MSTQNSKCDPAYAARLCRVADAIGELQEAGEDLLEHLPTEEEDEDAQMIGNDVSGMLWAIEVALSAVESAAPLGWRRYAEE